MACALVTHVAVYRSVLPDDRLHAYLSWYAPLVAVASVCSMFAIAAGGLWPGSAVARPISLFLPARTTRCRARTVGGLAIGALAFLVLQESLERSLDAGAFTVATFDVSIWPMLVSVLVLSAAAVLASGRIAVALSDVAVGERAPQPAWRPFVQSPGRTPDLGPGTPPLGCHAGLRAPPFVA